MQVFLQRFIERHFHSGRGGRAKLAISTNLLARIVGAAVSLINVPLAVRYLGNEGYGLLTVIVSTVGWIQFSNLGLGFGLQNTLTEQTALGNKQVQRELVSSTFFALLGIGALLALVTCLSFPHIHWTALFPPKSDRFVHEIPTAAALALGCFIASMVWGFIQPIYAARQELHLFNLQGLIANVTSLLTLYAAVKFDTGLLGIAVANIGVNALFAAGFALWTIFGRGIEEIRPSWSFVTEKATKSVLRTGLGFLILQVCTIVAFQSDAFLIAQFLSADQVTPYSVAQRVFAQLIGLLGIITAPLWPAFGNAKALGDVPWIQRIYRQVNFYFVAAYGAAFLFMAFAGHFLFHLWVGEASAPSMLLICAIGLYYFVMQWANNHSILLNGLGVIRKQTFAFVAQAALALGLNIFFVRKLGPIGLTLGGGLAYLAINAWYLPWLFHKTVKSIEPQPAPIQPNPATT